MHSSRRNTAQLVRFSDCQCSFCCHRVLQSPHPHPHPRPAPSPCDSIAPAIVRLFAWLYVNFLHAYSHLSTKPHRGFLLPEESRMLRQLPSFPRRIFTFPHFHIGGQRGVAHYVKSCWQGFAHISLISPP